MWCSRTSRVAHASACVGLDFDTAKAKPKARKLKLTLLEARVDLWLFGLIFLVASPALATTYYVAAAGSDSNSGTDSGHPWQTVAR